MIPWGHERKKLSNYWLALSATADKPNKMKNDTGTGFGSMELTDDPHKSCFSILVDSKKHETTLSLNLNNYIEHFALIGSREKDRMEGDKEQRKTSF